MKKVIIAVLLIIIAGTSVFYIFICNYNTKIAKTLELTLLNCPLPEETELIDSANVAGKVFGNGNGMQWFGMILVKSDLNENELFEWYGDQLNLDENTELEVLKQDNPAMFKDVDTDKLYIFDDFKEYEDYCFQVRIFKNSVSGLEESFLEKLLNLDFRAH